MGQWTGFMILIYGICLYLIWCIGVQIQHNANRLLRVVVTALLIITGMGSAVRMVYAWMDNIKALHFLSWFYFASTIGIILLSIIGIWYISPLYEKQGKCIIGIVTTKNLTRKSQYLVYALGFILMLVDGLSIVYTIQVAIPPFSFSEAYGLFAILYGFSNNRIIKSTA